MDCGKLDGATDGPIEARRRHRGVCGRRESEAGPAPRPGARRSYRGPRSTPEKGRRSCRRADALPHRGPDRAGSADVEGANAMSGPELVSLRTRRGWTQARLAQALGVAVSTIHRWETGKVPISTAMSIAIRAKLG